MKLLPAAVRCERGDADVGDSNRQTDRARAGVSEAHSAGAGARGQFRAVLPINRSDGERVARGKARDGEEGLLPPGQGGKTKKTPSRRKRAHFIPVRVESSNGAGSGTGMACRLRHPSGFIIECASWPDLNWMRGLLGHNYDAPLW